MINHYIYDGSFDGLLTSIYEAYYRKEKVDDIVPIDNMEENFIVENILIETDNIKAKKVYESIKTKISEEALKKVFYIYLSEVNKHGILILKYIQLGYRFGADIDLNLGNDIVLETDRIRHKVKLEKHRMLGLVRFRKIQSNILYSVIEPQYNIIGLIAPHFALRMMNEKWIIHDIKRGIGIFYNKQEWTVKNIEQHNGLIIKETEEGYEELWRTYFQSIAIENKINTKLQKRYMPKRYWKHLIEKQ